MIDFAEVLRLEAAADDVWGTVIDPDWMQGRAAFGGLVAALGLEALRRGVEPERRPRSVHTAFVGPVGPGPVEVRTTRLRAGRAFTHARAEVMQGGQVRAQITAALGAARPSKLVVEPRPGPALPRPESLPALPYIEGVMPRFVQHCDFRYASPHLPFSGATEAVIEGYVRLRGVAGVSPHAALLALFDAWPSPILCLADRPVPASSVFWSTTFAEVPEALDPGAFWGFRGVVEQAAAGHVAARGAIYGPDGRLAAIEEQLVTVFDG